MPIPHRKGSRRPLRQTSTSSALGRKQNAGESQDARRYSPRGTSERATSQQPGLVPCMVTNTLLAWHTAAWQCSSVVSAGTFFPQSTSLGGSTQRGQSKLTETAGNLFGVAHYYWWSREGVSASRGREVPRNVQCAKRGGSKP